MGNRNEQPVSAIFINKIVYEKTRLFCYSSTISASQAICLLKARLIRAAINASSSAEFAAANLSAAEEEEPLQCSP
jgi:hypothetical protein